MHYRLFSLYLFLYIYLLHDGYATGSSILPLFSSCPLLAVSVAFTRLSHGSFSLFLFSQLSPLFFLFPLCLSRFTLVSLRLCSAAIFLCLTEIRQRCMYDIHSCIRTCKKYQKIIRFRLIIGKGLN